LTPSRTIRDGVFCKGGQQGHCGGTSRLGEGERERTGRRALLGGTSGRLLRWEYFMKESAGSLRSRTLARILALATAVYVPGELSLLAAKPPGAAPTVWPPAGIALAGLLLGGYRVWPGICLGAFLTYSTTSWDGSDAEAVLRSLAGAAGDGLGQTL